MQMGVQKKREAVVKAEDYGASLEVSRVLNDGNFEREVIAEGNSKEKKHRGNSQKEEVSGGETGRLEKTGLVVNKAGGR